MSRPFGVVAALAAAGLLAAGCSHSGSPSATSTTSTRAPATSSTVARSTTTTSAITTSTTAGTAVCTNVTAATSGSQGAAGTIVGTINLTNSGTTSCTMTGYPTMALFASGGMALTVTIVDGLTVGIPGVASEAPAPVTVAPGAPAQFTYQYSDVPTGSETTCPSSATAAVTPPGTHIGSPTIALALAPCDNGTIHVSPMYIPS